MKISIKKSFRQVADFCEGMVGSSSYLLTGGLSIGYSSGRPTSKAYANGGMTGICTVLTGAVTTAVVAAHQAVTLMR